MNKYEIRCVKMNEFRMETDGDTVRLVGHAAVYNSFSEDLGGFKEIIRPDAFTRTLANRPDLRFLIGHDGLPLARTASGTLHVSSDERGLAFNASMDKSDPDVQRIIPKIKRGDLTQMSFGFRCMKDNYRTENGQVIRELHDCELDDGDISIVTYPAYKAADVSMRGLEAARAGVIEYRKRCDAELAAKKGLPVGLAERMLLLEE